MKLQSLFFATLLTLSGSVWADTQTIALQQVGSTWTAGYSISHLAGAFTDTFIFTPGSTAGLTETMFLNNTSTSVFGIEFKGATLNGNALSFAADEIFPGTLTTIGSLSPTYIDGNITLVVTGIAGANASYAGTINILSAVPEPGSYGMLLGGLGLLGVIVRRRQQR